MNASYAARNLLLSSIAAFAVIACSGGNTPLAPAGGRVGDANLNAVSFRIDADAATAQTARKHPQYLSPATRSISIVVTPSGASPLPAHNASLTVSGAGCTSTLASEQCTFDLPLAAGSYTASVATYSGDLDTRGNPTGALLSDNQAVAFSVVAGATNQVGFTLFGVPATIGIRPAPTEVNVIGNAGSGYALIGTADTAFDVIAYDETGNAIVGLGSPMFSVASSGSQITVDRQPSATSPGRFLLRAPAFAPTSAQVTATVANGTQIGAVCPNCSQSVPVSAGAVTMQQQSGEQPGSGAFMEWPGSQLVLPGVPSGLLAYFGFDANNVAYGVDATNAVYTAPAPYDSAARLPLILPSDVNPNFFAVDGAGTIYFTTPGFGITEPALALYSSSPPYSSSSPIWSTNASSDSNSVTALQATGNGSVALVWQTNTGATHTVVRDGSGQPFADAGDNPSGGGAQVDRGGDGSLLALEENSSDDAVAVSIFKPSVAPITFSTGIVEPANSLSAASDASGDVYVEQGNGITVFEPPYSAANARAFAAPGGRSCGPLISSSGGIVASCRETSTPYEANLYAVSAAGNFTPYNAAPAFQLIGVLP